MAAQPGGGWLLTTALAVVVGEAAARVEEGAVGVREEAVTVESVSQGEATRVGEGRPKLGRRQSELGRSASWWGDGRSREGGG